MQPNNNEVKQIPVSTATPVEPTEPAPAQPKPQPQKTIQPLNYLLAVLGMVALLVWLIGSQQQPAPLTAQANTPTPIGTGWEVQITNTVTASLTATPTKTPIQVGSIVTIIPSPTRAPTATPTPTYPPVKYPLVVQGAGRYVFSEPKPILEDQIENLFLVDWTADSQYLLAWRHVHPKNIIQLLDLNGQVVTDFGTRQMVPYPVLSANSQMIAFRDASEGRRILLVDASQSATTILTEPYGLALQPWGDSLWMVNEQYQIVWLPSLQQALDPYQRQVYTLLNASNSYYFADPDGKSTFQIAVNPANGRQAIFYTDKDFLFIDLQAQKVINLDLGEKESGGHAKYWAMNVKWSPNGHYVAVNAAAGERPVNFSTLFVFTTDSWTSWQVDLDFLHDMSWGSNSLDLFLTVDAGKSKSIISTSKLYVLNILTKEQQLIRLFHEDVASGGMIWSHDGKKAIISCSLVNEYNDTYLKTGRIFAKRCLVEVQQ